MSNSVSSTATRGRLLAWYALTMSVLLGSCAADTRLELETQTADVIAEAVVKKKAYPRRDAFFVYGSVRMYAKRGALEWADIECLRLRIGNTVSARTYIDSIADLPVQEANTKNEVLAKIYWVFSSRPEFGEEIVLDVFPIASRPCYGLGSSGDNSSP